MATYIINGSGGGTTFEFITSQFTNNYAPNYEPSSNGDMVLINHKYEVVRNIAQPTHYSLYEVNGVIYGSAKELVNALNSIINFSTGGGAGSLVVADDNFFTTTIERDDYFTANPDKLKEGVSVVVNGELQRWNGSEWVDMTPIVRGEKGDKGDKGDIGQQGEQGIQGIKGKDGLIQSIREGNNIKVDNTDPANPIISSSGGSIPISPITVVDVTNMFTTNVPVEDFLVRMESRFGRKPIIRMFGQDTSGNSNTLIVTAEHGFGSYYGYPNDRPKILHGTDGLDEDNNPIVGHYPVIITQETNTDKTTLIFDSHIHDIDLTYWLGTAIKSSCWIDMNDISHPFGIDNTPISNLCKTGGQFIINGENVQYTNIKALILGDDYLSLTEVLDGNFLYDCYYLTKLDISGLANAETIRIFGFAGENANISEIQIGSGDWSIKTLTGTNNAFSGCQNIAQNKIYANTVELGNAFKIRFPNISNWTVVANL